MDSSPMRDMTAIRRLQHWGAWTVAIIMAVVPFHAFLTVWGATFVGHFTLLRLWSEALLLVLVVLSGLIVWRSRELRRELVASPLIRCIGLYGLITLVLGAVALVKREVVPMALAYALVINLRFLVFLVCVWVVCWRTDWLRRYWRRVVFVPLAAVVVFGLLQFFVLPSDFLKHFGYNDATSYVAMVTLNQDSATMRIQSFLRGSNPLGAYLVAIGILLLLYVRPAFTAWRYWVLGILTAAALFLTFSRSAWLAAVVAAVALGWLVFAKYRMRYVGAVVAGAVIAAIGLSALYHIHGIQNALQHHTDQSTAQITSNEGHQAALRASIRDFSAQPLGGGPGTAGQASFYNTGHEYRNTESNWLQLALEVGWPGLVVFAAVLLLLGRELWLRRSERLAVGLLAGLVGLQFVNLLAYGWSDDTLAFAWWGLAGVVLALPPDAGMAVKTRTKGRKTDA